MLDLEKTSSSFRRLDRPISVQTESRLMAVSRHYEEMKAQQLEIDVVGGEEQRTLLCPIFHYPSFCSNEAIILHLLFRLIPYAFRLIQFQGEISVSMQIFCRDVVKYLIATNTKRILIKIKRTVQLSLTIFTLNKYFLLFPHLRW